METTLFEKIIARELPADIVYEDEQVLAFKDIAPIAPIHYLIIPKKPIATLDDTCKEDQALLGHMLLTATELARQAGINKSGYKVKTNVQSGGGQVVFHLHMHLYGGWDTNS